MKIKEIKINRFKRFSDLTIRGIDSSVKLVVLVGPNGSGKTSLFEALNFFNNFKGYGNPGNQDFSEKKDGIKTTGKWYQNKVNIKFYDFDVNNDHNVKGKFYFRTAYRNDPDFTVSGLNKKEDPTKRMRFNSLMGNDQTVSDNYERLVSQTLAGVYEEKNNAKTVETLREELIGKVKESINNIFDDLTLSSIGDPLTNGSFYFEKGLSKDFHYRNLSAGEKSVFDLILDLIIKSGYYDNSIYCVDEPEAHMHTKLQSVVLKELFRLINDKSQLWISTHSVGMINQAEKLEKENPGSVVFLDFNNKDFDSDEVIEPESINRSLWNKFVELSFGDFSNLISPEKIVFCEGTSKGRKYKDFDAIIYDKIFNDEFYNIKFISIGSCNEIENLKNDTMKIISKILNGSKIVKIVDRDDKSEEEVKELVSKNINVLKRRHIESYMFDDEILINMCEYFGKDDLIDEVIKAKENAIENSVSRGNPRDDIKSASGEIYINIKKILGITQCGNNKCSFVRDTLTKFVTPDTLIYNELKKELEL